jgi:hypothetical protein
MKDCALDKEVVWVPVSSVDFFKMLKNVSRDLCVTCCVRMKPVTADVLLIGGAERRDVDKGDISETARPRIPGSPPAQGPTPDRAGSGTIGESWPDTAASAARCLVAPRAPDGRWNLPASRSMMSLLPPESERRRRIPDDSTRRKRVSAALDPAFSGLPALATVGFCVV